MAGKRFSLPVFLLLSLVLLLSAAATFAQEADTTTTGGIYGRIKGTVTAESDGSPLRGINVEIYPYEGSDWAYDEPYAWIGTDSAGAYTLRGLEPGIYRVIFRDSSGQYLDEYYDNAPGWYWATRVMVLAGQATKNINAELQEGVPPVNDDFDNAIEISSLPYYDARPTYGATIAGDDPTLCGHLEQGPSVWYRFTPQVDQSVAISSIGSDYDTVLALWQGERGALDLVDCSDDLYEGQLYLAAVLYSNRLTAGVTYYIEAAGKNTGSLRFSGLPLQPGVIYVSPDGRQTVEGLPAHRADILIFDEIA